MKNPAKKLTLSITAGLLLSSLLLQSAFADNLPAGYVVSGGLTWTSNNGMGLFSDANGMCANKIESGADNWRLPTQQELSALYSASKSAFTTAGWTLNYTWSSTAYGAGSHYFVYLDDGLVGWAVDSGNAYVTCVH